MYEKTVGSVAISQLRALASNLTGMKVVHVNSTRVGGGVAEILEWMVPLMQDIGLNASWEVIEGNDEYFKVTKMFHNGLQGNAVSLTQSNIDHYEKTVKENAERLRPILTKADFVIIHDPQPAALLEMFPHRKGKWIWRCHIDLSSPSRNVWKYVKSKVSGFDSSIFSMKDFAQSLPHPQFIIAPSIDPLSEKNCELGAKEIGDILRKYRISRKVPVITQISRFDRFKDPIGVINAFNKLHENFEAELVLAGGGATDDPEGAEVLQEVKSAANNESHIHVLLLPNDAHRTINALQRGSTIVLQKSIQEGFGLTVTEALWKGKPVIGGNVGGIRLQVHNYHTGFLVNTPEGATLRMRELLRRPALLKRMGKIAHHFVKDNYLSTRTLREYLTLMLGLSGGLSNHILAECNGLCDEVA
jgi:trehalose synthase